MMRSLLQSSFSGESMSRFRNTILAFQVVVLFAPSFYAIRASAVVDMKNANYAISRTDVDLPGSGVDLKLIATYNSRSLFNGMFGFGWCTDLETKLEVTPEGNLKLTECGAGSEFYFYPRPLEKGEVQASISQILAKEKSAGTDGRTLARLERDLLTNEDQRFRLAQKHKISAPIREGTQFRMDGVQTETIVLRKGMYERTFGDGRRQRFNLQGRLTHMIDSSSRFTKLEYDSGGLRELVDSTGRRLRFEMNTNRKVRRVTGPNNVRVDYEYANLDDLVRVRNQAGEVTSYAYDDLKNLTRVVFPDKTSVAIEYDRKNDWVVGFLDREKCRESYTYETNPKNPKNNHWSTVKKTCGDEVVNESRYEFWWKDRANGTSFLERVSAQVNNNVTDITYHPVFSKPVRIRRNNEISTFEYFPNGQVRTKQSSRTKLTYKYYDNNKVKEVLTEVSNDKGKVVSSIRSEFFYDKDGNLRTAANSAGQKVTMEYDEKGRIEKITDQARKTVTVTYDERFGKPSRVTRPGLGSVQVTYRSNGDIERTASPEGPSVALQVASTFQNYLDVLAPATAELFNN